MGGFVALVLLCLMFAGSIGLWNKLIKAVDRRPKAEQREAPNGPRRIPQHPMQVFIKALENEGYIGHVKLPDTELRYVDDPVLAGMIERLANEYELEWELPKYQLRYRQVPNDAPDEFKAKYQWVVLTPTHAIGYR